MKRLPTMTTRIELHDMIVNAMVCLHFLMLNFDIYQPSTGKPYNCVGQTYNDLVYLERRLRWKKGQHKVLHEAVKNTIHRARLVYNLFSQESRRNKKGR